MIKKRISILLTALALTIALPAAAFAVDSNTGISANDAYNQTITWDEAVNNTGDTEYWLQLETGSMAQISIDVPVRVVLAVNTDGTFVTPTAKANVIENNSDFPVNVSAIAIAPQTGFTLKPATGFEALADENIFNGVISSVTLNEAGTDVGTTKQSIAFSAMDEYEANTAWAMQHGEGTARDGDDCLFVQIEGAIANVSGHYFTAPINVFDITYTFQATPATSIGATTTAALAAPVNITD